MAVIEKDLVALQPEWTEPLCVETEVNDPYWHFDDLATIYQEIRPNWRQLGRRLGGAVLFSLAASAVGVFGVSHTDTDTRIGPHDAKTHLTFDGHITFTGHTEDEAGKDQSSSLTLPSTAPFGLGASVEIDHIPLKITKQGLALTDISDEELKAYGSLFGNIDQDAEAAKKKMLHTFEMYTALGGCILWAGWKGVNYWRQQRPHHSPILLTTARYALVGGLLASGCAPVISDQLRTFPAPNVAADFQGFPLQNVTVGGKLLGFIESSRHFGEVGDANVRRALADKTLLTDPKNEVLIEVIEGNKCSAVGARLSGTIAEVAKPDIVLLLGDNALGGTPLDVACWRNLTISLQGTDIYAVTGQHDPLFDTATASQLGITLLNAGEVIEDDGLDISGALDPEQRLTLEKRSTPTSALSLKTVGHDLATTCWLKEPVDIQLANEPAMNKESYDSGCPRLIFSGGFEHKLSTQIGTYGTSTEYQAKSSAGATYNDDGGLATAGQFRESGEDTLIVYNKNTNTVTNGLVVVITPSAFAYTEWLRPSMSANHIYK